MWFKVALGLTAGAVLWKVYFDKEGKRDGNPNELIEEPVLERYLYVDPAGRTSPFWEDYPMPKVGYQESTTNYLPAVDYQAPGGSKMRVRRDMGQHMGYGV